MRLLTGFPIVWAEGDGEIVTPTGASILAAVVAVQLFELPYSFNPLIWIAGVGAGILVVCISGFFAARGAINAAPVDVLRGAPA